jgi:restriction system protein
MPIPDYQTVMLPLLAFASDGKEHRFGEAVKAMADHFGLSDVERNEQLSSDRYKLYDRVSWAKTYLKGAVLLEDPQRGFFRITERGISVLSKKPAKIDLALLRQFPEFVAFEGRTATSSGDTASKTTSIADATPTQLLESGFGQLRQQIESQLLDRVKACSPQFLEQLALQLLKKMGYGDSLPEAGKRVGGPGDGGVDVVIKEDLLGLDVLFVQAKRYTTGSVGRPEIQGFVGALQGTNKGIFITTSTFTAGAIDYVKKQKFADKKVVLINGEELARLMYEHGVGVSKDKSRSYVIKPVDPGFFEEGASLLGDE